MVVKVVETVEVTDAGLDYDLAPAYEERSAYEIYFIWRNTMKEVGGIYWCPEQECIVQVFRIDPKSSWPYICGDLESTGDENPLHGDTFEVDATELWDREECLKEIARLEAEIKQLRDYVEQVEQV